MKLSLRSVRIRSFSGQYFPAFRHCLGEPFSIFSKIFVKPGFFHGHLKMFTIPFLIDRDVFAENHFVLL